VGLQETLESVLTLALVKATEVNAVFKAQFGVVQPPVLRLEAGAEYTTRGVKDGVKGWDCRVGGYDGKLKPNRFGQIPVIHFTPFPSKPINFDGHIIRQNMDVLTYHWPDGRACNEGESYDIKL